MNHNKIVNTCLKYFNFLIGILMFVVLSLNIDSIFSNIHKFQDLNNLQKHCINCNQNSLSTLIIFNVEASLLASFLAVFSFLLAFRSENWFINNYKWFIPSCFLETIITCLYFVFTLIQKMPETCRNLETECGSEFKYNFEYKLIPMSLMMLVLIPQFLIRSLLILNTKCKNKKYNSIRKYSFKKNSYENEMIESRRSCEILDTENQSFRELAIDCPKLPDLSANNKRDENFNLIIEQTASDIENNNQMNRNRPTTTLVRNSSLSTIAEEKTMSSFNTLLNNTESTGSPSMSKSIKQKNNYNALIVKSFLNDLQDHKMLMNEIKNVFSPKDGEFSRNIAIRFKSSTSIENFNFDPISPVSTLISSSHQTMSLNNSNNDSIKNQDKYISFNKYRFAKHLKNRIETKKGRPVNSLMVNGSSATSGCSNKDDVPVVSSPQGRIKKQPQNRNGIFIRQKNYSKRVNSTTENNDRLKLLLTSLIEEGDNDTGSSIILQSKKMTTFLNGLDNENLKYIESSSKIAIKPDVSPVYF